MKEGWVEKTIGEVCLLKSGNSKANNSKSGDLPYIKVGDMNLKGNETFITISSTYVDRQDNSQNIFPVGTLIFPKRGGAIFTNKKRLTKIEICCDLNVMGVIPNKDIILPLFLYYFFKTIDFNIFKNEGASIPQINNKNIAPILIYLPSLSEQQSIVDYLDSAFAKIDAMKANAEKALNEAKALFQASLKEMLESKEGWEEKTLGEVGTFIRGGNFSKKDFVEDGFPCIHYGQIHTKFGVATFENLSCVPETMVKEERCASKGDLVIAITSEDDEGSCKCTAWMADYNAYVGGHAAIFKHSLNPIFVSYYFKAARFQKAKLEYTHGFKVVEISPKDIAKIPICYPSLAEQQTIVNTLDTLKSKVDRLQENFDKISQECDALKQAILRQVFE